VLRRWRLLARIMAIVLLTWTAVDLAFPECCLSEKLLAGSASGTLSTPEEAGTPSPDVDDCFCCAMCIDTGVRAPGLRIEPARTLFVEPVRHLATRVTVLDHPPQLA
jgi:hypothetical protein